MQTFEHVSGSGRFTVSPGLLDDWLDEVREFADLITYSEVDKNNRAAQLKDKGWGAVYGDKGPRDDCGIAWRQSIFKEIWSGTITLDDPGYKNKRGWITDPSEAAFAALEIEGEVIIVGKAHMPTSIASRRVYHRTARSFKRQALRLAKKHNAVAIILDADWNRDLRLPKVRTYLRKLAPKFRVNFKMPFPKNGTFGRRLIDYTLLWGSIKVVKRARLMATTRVSDHTAYRETLQLTKFSGGK